MTICEPSGNVHIRLTLNIENIVFSNGFPRGVIRRQQHAAVRVTGSLWWGAGPRDVYHWRQKCDRAREVAMDGEVANIFSK